MNINGNQTGSINYTTDGINTQDNLLNGSFNTNVSNTVSIDRVEEFRIVTSPADAEYGRGGAQVQMVTRGGESADSNAHAADSFTGKNHASDTPPPPKKT